MWCLFRTYCQEIRLELKAVRYCELKAVGITSKWNLGGSLWLIEVLADLALLSDEFSGLLVIQVCVRCSRFQVHAVWLSARRKTPSCSCAIVPSEETQYMSDHGGLV